MIEDACGHGNTLRKMVSYREVMEICAETAIENPKEAAYIVEDCGAQAFITSASLAEVATQLLPRTPKVTLRLMVGEPVDGYADYEPPDAPSPGGPYAPSPHMRAPLFRGLRHSYSAPASPAGPARGARPPHPTAAPGAPRASFATPLTRGGGLRGGGVPSGARPPRVRYEPEV